MRTFAVTCGFLLFFFITGSSHALDVPPLRHHVNDYAEMLSAAKAGALEAMLADLEKSDSTQIVILTIPSLAGENLEAFSIKAAEAWRIGQKGKDNGVIILLAKQERKIRIEVGRGLEGKLTDLVSGRIIRDQILPGLKAGDTDGGLTAGTLAIIEVVRGEYKAVDRNKRQGQEGAGSLMCEWSQKEIRKVALQEFDGIANACVSGNTRPYSGLQHRRHMKAIEEVLLAEEAKWRGKTYEEIESILETVQCYEIIRRDIAYQIEVHSRKGTRDNEIIVMVECSKTSFLGILSGRATYFVISKDSSVREVEEDEAF
ncbi:MAG: YgcG family protein [Syntrophobacteraceae bacterium]